MLPPAGRTWVIAHRGASHAHRENTLDAFRAARRLGADAVELDVRPTADGRPVVHHDAAVAGLGPIVERSAAALQAAAPWLPTLAEALAACAGMWVDVEIKNSPADPDWDPEDRLATAVLATIEEAGRAEQALITSFNPATLARVRLLAPALPTGLLLEAAPPAAAVAAAAPGGHAFVLPAAAALRGEDAAAAVALAEAAGLGVITWTVDEPGEIRRLAEAGLAGVITNCPDVARSVLDEHHDRGGR